MRGDKSKLLLKNTEPELEDLGDAQFIYISKKEKACTGETTQGVTGQSFAKEIMGM